jgi:glycolate oxidase FAD binding subunit
MDTPLDSYREVLARASESGTPVVIRGSGSKSFYGRPVDGTPLDISAHTGIIDYSPPELVITARAGTRLADLEDALAAEDQMLPFEPPHFGPDATLGGTIACGLSGPRRPFTGAARDFVLGITCINGRGELLRFGGQVMKNVAGYDISRTLTGSLGSLALLLEISLKVLPRAQRELTLRRQASETEAIALFNRWAGQPLPLSAAAFVDGELRVRLSGFEQGVAAAADVVGGEEIQDGDAFWQGLREQTLSFFTGDRPLWRVSVPPASAPLQLEGETLLDWGGAQRWIRTDRPADVIRRAAGAAGGHATRFRDHDRDDVFHPLPAPLLALQQRLKASFDPAGILNPGHMYPGL